MFLILHDSTVTVINVDHNYNHSYFILQNENETFCSRRKLEIRMYSLTTLSYNHCFDSAKHATL